MNQPEENAPQSDRRQFLGSGLLKAAGYTAPVVTTLAVSTLVVEEAEAYPGMMMMMMMRMRMMMMMKMMMMMM
jgi:hypothetical protein